MNKIKNFAAVAGLLVSIPAVFPALCHAGGADGSGGGDRFAAHFAGVGKEIGTAFRLICREPDPSDAAICKISGDFTKALRSARILPRETLSGQDGKPREAGPDGRGNIELNVLLYSNRIEQPGSGEKTVALVTHEYMIVTGQEEVDTYSASSTLLKALRRNHIDVEELAGSIQLPASAPTNGIKACSDYTAQGLRQAAIGFECYSASGEVLSRVAQDGFGEAWKTPDGVIWSGPMGNWNYSDSAELCKSVGGALPTKAEFSRAHSKGFEFVLPGMGQFEAWTSAINPKDFSHALTFQFGARSKQILSEPNSFYSGFGTADRAYEAREVRCVVR